MLKPVLFFLIFVFEGKRCKNTEKVELDQLTVCKATIVWL